MYQDIPNPVTEQPIIDTVDLQLVWPCSAL